MIERVEDIRAPGCAFSLDRNEYQGETYLELSVADIKALE